MDKKQFLLLNLFIFAFITIPIDAKLRYEYSPYECQLEAELDLGVIGRKLSFVFEFFDQSKFVANQIFVHRESMYKMIILPMYDRCKGDCKAMINLIRSSKKEINRILKSVQKAGAKGNEITKTLKKRRQELASLLCFMKKNRQLISMLWGCAKFDVYYGQLIQTYKSEVKKSEGDIEDGAFEKELLYVANKRISRKHRKYPLVYFMRRFLLKDLIKYKKLCERSFKKFKSDFLTEMFEDQFNSLVLIKYSIEGMHSYKNEKRALLKRRIIIPSVVAIVGVALWTIGILKIVRIDKSYYKQFYRI